MPRISCLVRRELDGMEVDGMEVDGMGGTDGAGDVSGLF